MGRHHSVLRNTKEASKKKKGGLTGITFDAGGVIALDRSDRRVLVFIARRRRAKFAYYGPGNSARQAIRNRAKQPASSD